MPIANLLNQRSAQPVAQPGDFFVSIGACAAGQRRRAVSLAARGRMARAISAGPAGQRALGEQFHERRDALDEFFLRPWNLGGHAPAKFLQDLVFLAHFRNPFVVRSVPYAMPKEIYCEAVAPVASVAVTVSLPA